MNIRVYIGFDSSEVVAYHALVHSIIEATSAPVSISALNLKQLTNVFQRERDAKQSTEFSFSRFLVPLLSGFQGHSIFMDCDMLLRADLTHLWNLIDPRYAVQVVKHDYIPKNEFKFLGNTQTKYEKKNWSSLMIFNNSRCTALTQEYVNRASGLELHQFKWLNSDDEIGGLPPAWNHLVDEYPYSEEASLVHFTNGGPWLAEFRDCDYSLEWHSTLARVNNARQK